MRWSRINSLKLVIPRRTSQNYLVYSFLVVEETKFGLKNLTSIDKVVVVIDLGGELVCLVTPQIPDIFCLNLIIQVCEALPDQHHLHAQTRS